jgi:hypothetical protein
MRKTKEIIPQKKFPTQAQESISSEEASADDDIGDMSFVQLHSTSTEMRRAEVVQKLSQYKGLQHFAQTLKDGPFDKVK